MATTGAPKKAVRVEPEVTCFLQNLELEEYIEALYEQGLKRGTDLSLLGDEELLAAGMKAVERKRYLRAVIETHWCITVSEQ